MPVLIVLDPTTNPKLTELARVFRESGGEVYVGAQAWQHLESAAGPTLGRFLKTYVHGPIADLLAELPPTEKMPELILNMTNDVLTISIDGDVFSTRRSTPGASEVRDNEEEMPEDADEEIAGL